MANRSVFEIIGPIMIGPSSSHTAGAVRIGKIARQILTEKPQCAEITLYGSFAKTYKGHGTDRALVGGLLGMDTDDKNIKEALNIACDQGLHINFKFKDSSDIHPNTAEIVLQGISGKSVTVVGSSIGGGNVQVSKINHFEIDAGFKYPTLLVEHEDKPGVIGKVTTILGHDGINIAEMKMARNHKGGANFMIIETDQPITLNVPAQIKNLPSIINAVKIDSV